MIARQLTLGQLVAAELIVTAVVAAFSKLGKYFESFYDLVASVDKLGHLTDLPTERRREVPLPVAGGGLCLDASAVTVRSTSGGTLSGVNLRLPRGGRMAIHGASGSGKTALVDALTGVRPHCGGRLDVEGIAVDEIEASSMRSAIAIVCDDGLFEGTIDENIRLGRGDLTRQDARLALQKVGIWDAVSMLPAGLDTRVATHGKGLPSDLVHRLVIARAIATRPRLLVLDGVLDRLSPASCAQVWQAVAADDHPWSLILTTTDRARLAWCEHAYVIDAGTLSPTATEETP